MRLFLKELLKYKQTKTAKELIETKLIELEKEYNSIHFTRINNDVNGNPRYVVHFLQCRPNDQYSYTDVVKLMNKIGGRKYHNKSYGGGIVFQSYSTVELENDIVKLRDSKC